ncbi:MAG: transposase [Myxococcaceae bacterium]
MTVADEVSRAAGNWFFEGYSLHANTHLHAHDREGLEKLCRYGARGALALERLTHAGEGRIAFRMKRPLPDGRTHLLFTPLQLLRKLATLVPPPRSNLVRFHGVFAPGAKLRPLVVKQVPSSGVRVATTPASRAVRLPREGRARSERVRRNGRSC